MGSVGDALATCVFQDVIEAVTAAGARHIIQNKEATPTLGRGYPIRELRDLGLGWVVDIRVMQID